jgi:hypothetical protein
MRTVHLLITASLALGSASHGLSQIQRDSLLSLLPAAEAIPGWLRADSAQIYAGNDLYLFIDGGADLFFEYGFRQVVATEYHRAGGEPINLEIYEMNDPGAAFGIYSIRSGEEATSINVGEEGSLHPYYIMFWKGRFYVSLAASDSTVESRGCMDAIARAVDQNLSTQGQKPDIVKLLPRDNLLKQRYIRGYLGMSSTRLLDVKGIFPAIEGAIGTYRDHTMIFIRFGDARNAGRHLADINVNLKRDKRFKGYHHRDQSTKVVDSMNQTVCFGRSGLYVIVSISSEEAVAELASKKGVTLLRDR